MPESTVINTDRVELATRAVDKQIAQVHHFLCNAEAWLPLLQHAVANVARQAARTTPAEFDVAAKEIKAQLSAATRKGVAVTEALHELQDMVETLEGGGLERHIQQAAGEKCDSKPPESSGNRGNVV